jgi:ATP/maltotriose-dependent transcriptional regulator MalT
MATETHTTFRTETLPKERQLSIDFEALCLVDAARNSGEYDRALTGYANIIRSGEENQITKYHPYLQAVLNLAYLFAEKGELEEAKKLLHAKSGIEPVLEEHLVIWKPQNLLTKEQSILEEKPGMKVYPR